jgi:hypothetical protein
MQIDLSDFRESEVWNFKERNGDSRIAGFPGKFTFWDLGTNRANGTNGAYADATNHFGKGRVVVIGRIRQPLAI